ncbi:PH domain-containing protein [Glaciecola siphonariae]|uniref:PH domain-containing protein n=1 Tax=Glaciecola siphonariae TaxID=521012 RepID=A0ABV9M1N1_9ALTE
MNEQIDIDSLDTSVESEKQLAKEIASDDWLRVSPIAILYFFVKTLAALSNFLIYLLPVFALNFSKVKAQPLLFIGAALGLMVIVMIGAVVKYLFYFYRLSADRVEIRQGMIKKSHLDLPFGKIQNVKIIQPFYYRFSDYSILELDTAGSAQQEANIVAIRLPIAESFKQKVQAVFADVSADNPSLSGDAGQSHKIIGEQEEILNRRSIKDLVVHGITNNRVWIFLGFLAPFYNVISENIGQIFSVIGLDISSYLNYESQTLWVFILHVLSVAMVIMLFIVLFSIVGSIFVFYDYRLSRSGQRYIRRSGLLTKQEISMNVSRIQRAVFQQDWLDIIIGRVNLRFEQNSAGIAGGNQAAQINSANKLIVPSVYPQQADELAQDVFDVQALFNLHFQSISPRYILRLLLFPCLPIFIALAALATTQEFSLTGWIVVMVIMGLMTGLCTLRWYRWGIAKDEDFLYIRKGLFGRDFIVFPIAKMQQTKFTQTLLMRARGLATLKFVLASGGMKVPYLPAEQVTSIIDEALLKVARDKPAWM